MGSSECVRSFLLSSLLGWRTSIFIFPTVHRHLYLLASEQLHVHGLIHRDIMSENIIFDGVSHIRLTDTVRVFGTDEVDSQANVGHPGHVYANKDACVLFGSTIASAGRRISLRQ